MASLSVPCPKISSASLPLTSAENPLRKPASLFLGSQLPKSAFSGFRCTSREHAAICEAHAKLNEVSAETSNSAPVVDTNSRIASSKEKVESAEKMIPEPSEISAFMAQVSDLVKLVDSRDIMELQLKQMGCELTIRKKEALQPVAPPPSIVMPQPIPQAVYPTPPLTAAPVPASQSPPASAPSALAAPKAASSSHPPLKCPMAGTLYRSPAPGEPPFVKVGDKVQKGQVVCIIEAMKLMNEIEADQSGTVTEILVEDGKPVSVDTPLFVIVP